MFSRFFSKTPKIEVFVRHCHFSAVSQHKNRFPHFSRYQCYKNLLQTTDPSRVNITYILDTFHPAAETHFVKNQTQYPVVEISEGSETGSFLKLLDYVMSLKLDPETIVYLLEDDYLHRPGWVDILLEGFSIPQASYITLFDHRDKYLPGHYDGLTARLFVTQNCHWRTTPSTTNTHAARLKTFLAHYDVHQNFSRHRKITADHEKFLALKEIGATLISPIPGWSTHVEPAYASPCFDWEQLLKTQ